MKIYDISAIQEELKKDLPGKESQFKMAPEIRIKLKSSPDTDKAAVLILLYPYKNELHTVLIKRKNDSSPHSGQVSLPGGKLEPDDKTLEYTAVRECEEEIGVNRNEIRIIGSLTSLYVHVSNFNILPFVGFIDYTPEFTADPNEVQYIMQTSLKNLINPDIIQKTSMGHSGVFYEVPYFDIHNEMVWGATAMILSEFITIINRIKN